MKRFVIILGILLLVGGVVGLVHPVFTYHRQEEVAKLGPFNATVDRERTAQIPAALSIALLLSGIGDRKSTRLNSSHGYISYAVFCLKKKTTNAHLQHGISPCALMVEHQQYRTALFTALGAPVGPLYLRRPQHLHQHNVDATTIPAAV